jgi:uncharacterized protein YggE
MNKRAILVVGLVLCFGVILAAAQGQSERPNLISVSSSGKVKAKPDVCLTVLEVRSSAPLASDALQQNEKRVVEIMARLKELGIKDPEIHWAGHQFAPSGGGRIYMPGGQRPTGFEVYNVLEIRIKNPDVSDFGKFSAKIASLLDELGKLGAGMLSPDLSRFSLGGSSAVVFALENPAPYERQAQEQAIEKAKPIAEQLAQKMGVKLTGIHSVQTNILPASRPVGGYEIEYTYAASSPDDLSVRANVNVNFSFKPPY